MFYLCLLATGFMPYRFLHSIQKNAKAISKLAVISDLQKNSWRTIIF